MLFVGVGVQVAHAAAIPPNPTPAECNCPGGNATACTSTGGTTPTLICTYPDGSTQSATITGLLTVWSKPSPPGSTAPPTSTVAGPLADAAKTAGDAMMCVSSGAIGCILSAIAWFIFQLCAAVLGFVGLIFNWVVVLTVFQFGAYFGNSAGLLLGWSILRDIGNIVLLFGFILMGIMTILDVHQFDTRKALPRLLIFAVFLNFSLFASEAVIDMANVLSATVYQQAGQSQQSCISTGSGASACKQSQRVGISGAIIEASGLTTVWNLGQDEVNKISQNNGTSALVLMLLAVFMLIAAVVLGAGAIMLFIRAITLIFLLVLSPLGFAAMAIPQLESLGKQWWSKLISQAFFAPVFILLILVSLKIVGSVQGIGSGGSFATAVGNPSSSTIGILIIFMIVIGFLIASLMVAKKMGAMGADYAIKTSGNLVGGATIGATAFVGRRTVGRASGAIAQKIRGSSIGEKGYGRFLAGVADKGASSSFDLRGSKTLKSTLGKANIDLGAPAKGGAHGYHGIEKKATDERLAYAKTLTGRNRKEEPAERAARIQVKKDLTLAAEKKSTLASQNKAAKLAAYNEALLTSQSAAAETEKQKTILSHLKERAAQTPTDAALAARVNAQESLLAQRQKEQSDTEAQTILREKEQQQADTELTKATEGLTKARVDEEAAEKVTSVRVSAKEQQTNYANAIEHSDWTMGVSAEGHANHTAAAIIKTKGTKSDIDRNLEAFRDSILKQAAEDAKPAGDHEEEAAHAPTPKPAGGAATPAAGGGDHGHAGH